MKILAIGAHPDDIELGCGGTLLKAVKEGHSVYMLTMTRGSASGNPAQRTNELMQSAKFIGAKDLRIDDLEDTRLSSDADALIRHIEEYADEVDPDLIFTHSSGDAHHDHRSVAAATLEAARFYSNILSYEIPLTKDFDPVVYYDISDVIEKKVELIRLFWSQSSKLYLQANAIRSLSEYRALQSRLNATISHVEAFEALRLCLDTDFRLMKAPFVKPEVRSVQDYPQEIRQRA
ncbi:MAG: PIG-L family deacetylase [Nitrososphaerota archaeon]|nr:PIG-L family deacetylase [Nitrososphaerota archaeon]